MDDGKKGTPLTLVADNSSVAFQKQRTQQELERSKSHATDAIGRLAVNLLRIIAGAGEPWALLQNIDEARAAYINYLNLAQAAGHPAEPPTREIDLDRLFSRQDREGKPVTEEDWRRWSQPTDPYEEYFESRSQAKIELRRAALRQVASVLSSGETREPSLKAHGGNLDDIIRSILDAQKQFEQQRAQPPKADPKRKAIADERIADLRREERRRQLESLQAHQVAGLRAVEAGAVDQTDGFTLDVLGSIKLLTRPKGSKKKTEWRLTDDGRLALEMHKQRER